MDSEDSKEIKVENNNAPICRCCLSTDRRMDKIDDFCYLLLDLAGIIVSESDGLPKYVCWECGALLRKSVRFKQKVLQIHSALCDYNNRCAPFSIDGQDPELTQYSMPYLVKTPTLTFCNNPKSKAGFYDVLQHETQRLDIELLPLAQDISADIKHDIINKDNIISDLIKNENVQTDNEEYCIPDNGDRTNDTDDSNESLLDLKKLRVRKRVKIKNKEDTAEVKVTRRVKNSKPDIDETKIRILRLDPMEQLKQREEECKKTLTFPYVCHLCYKGFIYESKLQNHMKKHSPSRGSYKCEICSMYLPTNYSLSVHMLIHTRRFECLQCGRQMTDKDSIINHYRTEHEGIISMFTCHVCGKIFNNSKTLRGHVRNLHTLKRVKCDECDKTLINADALAEHKLIHQGVKEHACGVCGKRFRTRQQMRYHQTRHSDAKNYYCVECDIRFKTSHALNQHLKKTAKHIDEQSLIHPCPRCSKRFTNLSELTHHLSVQHDGVRAHRCPTCPAALATKSSLQKHVRMVHSGIKVHAKHVCDTCGRVFNAKSTLTNHIRTHTGEKPFECEQCGRHFAQRTALKTHVKLVHLKLHRNAKIKPKQPEDIIKYKEESPIVFEWPRQSASGCEFFTVTAGP
ncbi:zinc finger protein 846-like [Pieris brassicae]|uniref:Uncharacterized protein n=1 Tax=Pieris brassicae TaxID=7116 RepID=A0A9P0XEI6_PIEBR|nr:zinc finger protein 846-like [Pieris brassicae]CAH4033281.1 unnamed protein product [Pieris brassicae]